MPYSELDTDKAADIDESMRTRLAALSQRIFSTVHGERGASLVEYALLVALIAVVCIVAVQTLGSSASTTLSGAGTSI